MNEQTECNQALPETKPTVIRSVQQALAENKADPVLERHSRKCQICRHPDREDIELDYLEWIRPSTISTRYDVPERTLSRHFGALGLASRRRTNLTAALENIIQRGAEAPITGDTVIRAVKAICCLDGQKWTEPAKQIIHTVQTEPKLAHEQGLRILGNGFHQSPATTHQSQISNRPKKGTFLTKIEAQTKSISRSNPSGRRTTKAATRKDLHRRMTTAIRLTHLMRHRMVTDYA